MNTRKPGPMDHEEAGYSPMDEPPGISELDYLRRWKAAGGQVAHRPAPPIHTPEPWQAIRNSETQSVLLAGSDGLAFACIMGPLAQTNGQRILLCVNALIGVPSSGLELGLSLADAEDRSAVAELVDAAEDFLKGGKHDGPCDGYNTAGICLKHAEYYDRRKDRLEVAIRAVR